MKSVPVVDEAKINALVVTPLIVEVTWGWELVTVIFPVALFSDMPVPAERDWTRGVQAIKFGAVEETMSA